MLEGHVLQEVMAEARRAQVVTRRPPPSGDNNGQHQNSGSRRRKRTPRDEDPGDGDSSHSDPSQFSDTPEGQRRRIAHLKKIIRKNREVKVKEADKVDVPVWPEPHQVQDWKGATTADLLAASNRPVGAAMFYAEIRRTTLENWKTLETSKP